MTTLLVVTAGQSDVQLVIDGARRELRRERCASLHDEIERRVGEWRLVDSPARKSDLAEMLPAGELLLCTPKLDAVLRYLDEQGVAPTAALVLETRRDSSSERSDPRFAGALLEARLRGKGIETIQRRAYLEGVERVEDRNDPRDAIIRRDVVRRLDQAVRECIQTVEPSRIVVATTGGMPVVSNLVEEIVRLHVAPGTVDLMEVADGAKASPPTDDRAVLRGGAPEPATSYQARRHALELIGNGNLLGAWGAVQHLHSDEVERRWTQVVKWLACFAASMPVHADCDIPVLTHPHMSVRAGLRVELALRAGDIPRAVHGTVAFFESALWDHLGPHLTRHDAPKKHRLFKVDPTPADDLIRRGDGSSDDRGRPFEVAEESDGVRWYKVFDDDVCGIRLAKHYLNQECLLKLGQAVSTVRELRNDVAHNEPTPQLMDDARRRMAEASLWSTKDRFLTQPLVQSVLGELREQHSDALCTSLVSTVRARLLDACPK